MMGRRRFILTAIVVFLTVGYFLFSCVTAQGPDDDANIRPPVVAGSFYPDDPDDLTEMVDFYLDNAARVDGDPVVLVVPHAGYVYSGLVAAYSFKQMEGGDYDTAVIIGNNHQDPNFAAVSVWAEGAWETPLGQVPVDEALAAQLLAADERIVDERGPHLAEHSIEVQLPFLQRVCPDCAIVPVLVGQPTDENIAALSQALADVLPGHKAVVIASTDLSHYPTYEDAQLVDGIILQAVETRDPDQVMAAITQVMQAGIPNLYTCACGQGPLFVAINVANLLEIEEMRLLAYANSGDIPGADRNRVVGYGAIMFHDWEPYTLTEADQQTLLQLARETLAARLSLETLPAPPTEPAVLQRLASVFVTLRIDGELRGCIGDMSASRPLVAAVQYAAQAAAFDDPRFPPLSIDEFDLIDIEISVLSPLRRVDDPEEIVIGEHGLVIRAGNRTGLLLPQVATERDWNREQFLEAVCRKAGLPTNAWQQGAALYTFSAQIFEEIE